MKNELERLEGRRMERQARIDSAKSPAERNVLGQFATPPDLALEIAKFAHGLWVDRKEKIRFLDPAIGTGAFFVSLCRTFPWRAIASATGVEIDPALSATARSIWAPLGLDVVNADFTKLSPPQAGKQPNLILTNPPYVRHHHITSQEKKRLQGLVQNRVGYRLSGLTGLYCYFLLLAHDWLSEEGLGIWLLPSEFMDVNYGSSIRRYLTERVTLLRVHRFDPSNVQFEDALVSSAIVVFGKEPSTLNHEAKFSFGGSLLEPLMEQSIPIRELAGGQRWGGLPQRNGVRSLHLESELRLSDLFSIKRGIATGANDFFILPRRKAEELDLPFEFLKPILPNPGALKEQIIKAGRDGWPLVDEQLVVVDCRLPEPHVKRAYPALWHYLHQGEQLGVRERYLVRHREPWYSQEERAAAPFLCTYMGRGVNGGKPFRFFWNRSKAIAHNVYLLLYPKGELKQILKEGPSLEEPVFRFLEGISRTDLVWEGRVYGGGLHKLEPGELGRVPADALFKGIGLERLTPKVRLPL